MGEAALMVLENWRVKETWKIILLLISFQNTFGRETTLKSEGEL
jgi:hypothetical protein